MIRVIVACAAKLHAFNLVEQLEQRGSLHTFFTTYAHQKNTLMRRFVRRVDQENISPQKIRTFLIAAIGRKLWDVSWLWNDFFDRWVAWKLRFQTDYDVFIGWAGMSAHSLKVARQMGKKTILIRSSAHIEIQDKLLREEFAKINQEFSIPRQEIAKELREYALADYINLPSSFALNTFLEKGFDPQKLFLNPLGVDFETFKQVESKVTTDNNEFKVVFLGSLMLRKGVKYLIEAVHILAKAHKFPKVLFVGGISKEIASLLSTLDLPQNCHFLGHIPQQDLKNTLSVCQLGVVPSIEDGFAQVIPQLLAMNIPVITTHHTGGPEMIRDGYNGYLVPIRNAQCIAECIEHLMDNPAQLQEMSQQARPSVSQGFTWTDYGNRDYAFMQQIVNDSKRVQV